jgi:AmmeMemoRadiSam system protein A
MSAAPASALAEARLAAHHGPLLLGVAADSIRHGLAHGTPLPVVPADYPAELREPHGVFVTLERRGDVRGCVGRLRQLRPVVQEVADNAFAAGFLDDRFPPLAAEELEDLTVQVSLLTPPRPIRFRSEAELLAQLVPGRDGLILKLGWASGLFLPAVWDDLPEPAAFLRHLKRKAGLPGQGLLPGTRAFRFYAECVSAGWSPELTRVR